MHNPDLLASDGRPRKRKGKSKAAANKAVIIWSSVLGFSALCVIAAAFFLWLRPMLRHQAGNSALASDRPDQSVRVASEFPSPSSEETIILVTQALANRDPDRVADFFRMGSSNVAEILAYCADVGNRDGKFTGYEWLSSLDTDELLVEGVLVNYEDKDMVPRQRLALLTPDEAGKWKLDFDSFSRKTQPSWDKLLEHGAGQAVVRVIVAPDVYYNGPFSDESRWTSYLLRSPDTEVLLRGYCRKDSPEADVMKRIFEDGAQIARVILEIRRVKDGGKLQFEITRVLARDWILPAKQMGAPVLPN